MEDVIRRDNFRQVRRQYKISLRDIARKCCLSPQTISNFENSSGLYSSVNARDYNSKLMICTLETMINHYKEAKMEESKNVVMSKPSARSSDILRKDFADNVKKYLMSNKLTMQDFCNMCGVAHGVFTDKYCETHPYLSFKHLITVMSATGWTEEQIRTGSFMKEDSNMSWVATAKSKAAMAAVTDQREIKKSLNKTFGDYVNVKYIFQDGQYFKEYDVIKHVTEPVSKEEFLKALED